MENLQTDNNINKAPITSFTEDDFDLQEHKKAANTLTQTKAYAKVARRKVAVGRAIIAVAAIGTCLLLWFMASMIVRAL